MNGRNLILWGPQVTVDRTFRLPNATEKVCRHFIDSKWFTDKVREDIQHIVKLGLKHDHDIKVPAESHGDLMVALDYLQTTFQNAELVQIGGNPGISALRGHCLGIDGGATSLPVVGYFGILPASVADWIRAQGANDHALNHALAEVFSDTACVASSEKPVTLALENEQAAKIMFSYGPGRSLDSINIGDLLNRLERAITAHESRTLLAFSVPYPLDKGGILIRDLKARLGHRVLIYIGCSSFRHGNSPDFTRVRGAWPILQQADILSMNESELDDLHSHLVGGDTYQDKPLAYKLLELPTDAIKVCHGSAGSILDAGPYPNRLLTEGRYNDPGAFLEESLRLATDGATFGIASPRGHDATEAAVKVFSKTVRTRNVERFNAMFLNVLESMPPGLIAVHTPVVARTMSALTGVGARFDGLLASFLMRS